MRTRFIKIFIILIIVIIVSIFLKMKVLGKPPYGIMDI
jgi:hypothetical protein